MTLIQLAQIVSESVAAIGVVAAGIGYFWGQIFIGRNKATKEDYNFLTTRLDALQKLCDQQQMDLNTLHQEIGRLKESNDLEKKKNIELTALLQNRDPALIEYMKFARDSIMEFKGDIKGMIEYQKMMDGKFNRILSEGKIT